MFQSNRRNDKAGQSFSSRNHKRKHNQGYSVDDYDDYDDDHDQRGFGESSGFPKNSNKKSSNNPKMTTTMIEVDDEDGAPEGKYVQFGDPLGRPNRPDRPAKRQKAAAAAADLHWAPSSFTSSRNDRASQGGATRPSFVPEDFMDDEDLESLGYAAGMKTKLPFATLGKPPPTASSSSLGQLLQTTLQEQLVSASQESIGTRLLVSMGWKEGQGIGAKISLRQRRSQKRAKNRGEDQGEDDNAEDDELSQGLLSSKVAPLEVALSDFSASAKTNRYGIGFDPIKNAPEMSYLGGQPGLKRGAKHKHSVEDDEDIYETDNMANYNIEISSKNRTTFEKDLGAIDRSALQRCSDGKLPPPGFRLGSKQTPLDKWFPPPGIPDDFAPHPTFLTPAPALVIGQPLTRANLTADERALALGEPERRESEFLGIAQKVREIAGLLNEIGIDPQTASLAMKGSAPFKDDPLKQARYTEFLERGAGLRQPETGSMANKPYEYLLELREFAKAARIFKPLSSVMAARFTTSSLPTQEEKSIIPKAGLFVPDPKDLPSREDKHEATEKAKQAAERMRPKLVRKEAIWVPNRLLCKRFNIANPYPDGAPTIPQSETKQQRKNQAAEKEAVLLDQFKRLRPAQPSQGQDSPGAGEPPASSPSSQQNTTKGAAKEEQTEPARPSMDIFKAIFENSESEPEDDEVPVNQEEEEEEFPVKPEMISLKKPEPEVVVGEKMNTEEAVEDFFGPQRPPGAGSDSSSSDSGTDESGSESEEEGRTSKRKRTEKKAKKEKRGKERRERKDRKSSKKKDRKEEKKKKKKKEHRRREPRKEKEKESGEALPSEGFLLGLDEALLLPAQQPRRPQASDFM